MRGVAGCGGAVVVSYVSAAMFALVAVAQVVWSLVSSAALPQLKAALGVAQAVSLLVLAPGGAVRGGTGDTMGRGELMS